MVMILFLRDKDNRTIAEIELYQKNDFIELSALVCIEPYSKFLLSQPEDMIEEVIHDFDGLQEARGWMWECYFMNKQNNADEYDNVLEELRFWMREVANKYSLGYVED